MPANLPPQYHKAELQYRQAGTVSERLELLRELFRLLPKHKGTEKLQSDLKQKISRAREELENDKGVSNKSGLSYRVPREGAGQVVLVGPPNAGKSTILAALTNAKPEIAAYPFTTRGPQLGMAHWEDVDVQLIDLPPVTRDFLEPWAPGIIRSADAALLVLDLASDESPDEVEASISRLADVHTELVGQLPITSEEEATQHVRTILVANKCDVAGSGDRLEIVREWFSHRYPLHVVSAVEGVGLESLVRQAYDLLGVIRIYTKVPGHQIDRSKPFTIPSGGTIEDLAHEIHRDLATSLKFAKVWGVGLHDGQSVKQDHVLHDGDIVELHA